MRIAITGGTGFVGAALITKLLNQQNEITALVRDRKKLKASGAVRVVEGDLEDANALEELARGADIFINLAGVTHARFEEDFTRVNVDGAVRAAKAAAAINAKFIHISSMSARKPSVSPYAQSKFASEAAIAAASGANPHLSLRLPAIYGPGDMVTLPFFKLVKSGFALEPKTTPPARASILYVEDAASAILMAGNEAPPGLVYEVGDDAPDGHAWAEIGAVLGQAMGKSPKSIRAPRGLVAAYHGIVRTSERLFNRPPSLRPGQINEFFHPDWVARDNLLSNATGWRAATPLEEGFAKTALWYQENGLL